MSHQEKSPDLIITLKYFRNDLYYRTNQSTSPAFHLMNDDTVFKVDGGWIVEWKLAENSKIEKINNITVNETKEGLHLNWKDIWAEKPKKVNTEGTIFQGTIKDGNPEPKEFNAYTIHYRTDGKDMQKDPVFQKPPY